LREFWCNYNQITKIENLPASLQVFECSDNQITKIENLPASLREFWCNYNQITKIENLPASLRYFDYGNTINWVDNIEYDRIKFTLLWYHGTKRLQKRRRRNTKMSCSIIQDCVRDWIWKPMSRDYQIGLRPKLDMEYLNV
jgi:Leucine-rich repeat (LRR) protein